MNFHLIVLLQGTLVVVKVVVSCKTVGTKSIDGGVYNIGPYKISFRVRSAVKWVLKRSNVEIVYSWKIFF